MIWSIFYTNTINTVAYYVNLPLYFLNKMFSVMRKCRIVIVKLSCAATTTTITFNRELYLLSIFFNKQNMKNIYLWKCFEF